MDWHTVKISQIQSVLISSTATTLRFIETDPTTD